MCTILLHRVWMRQTYTFVVITTARILRKLLWLLLLLLLLLLSSVCARRRSRWCIWYGNESARDLHRNNISVYTYFTYLPTHNNNNIMFMRFSQNSNRDQKGVLRVCFINLYRNLKSHISTIWIISVHNNSPFSPPHAQLYNNYGNISENSIQLRTPRWLHLYSGCVSNRVCHYRLVRSFWIGTSKYCQTHPREFIKIF